MEKRPPFHSCLRAAVLVASFLAACAHAAASPLAHPAASYLVQVNGETYREKGADRKLSPASLTKIMTALVVIEKCPLDRVVTISRNAASESGSRIGLKRGERLTVRDLLAATLISSANDAARALADHTAGNQKRFVELMNKRARSLQLHNTHFTNASGHDHASHYSSAHDLALLTNRALLDRVFADLVSRRSMRITTANGKRSFHLVNKNRLIGRVAVVQRHAHHRQRFHQRR
jgi:serine-type D-Ala-D-Ala carboxypeptidase (penicillin-binding protein 5/6)